jgi:hypothetical protein
MSHTMSHNYSQLWVSLVVEPIPENREISTHRLGKKKLEINFFGPLEILMGQIGTQIRQ